MKKYLPSATGLLAVGLLLLGGCAKNQEVAPTITNIAVTNPDFQALEDAAIRGDVAVLLGNKNEADPSGNFTVFAPTNAAFARLGLRTAADLTALQQPFLRSTLFYHVFSGTLPGSALTAGAVSPSALGPTRRIIVRPDGSKYVNGSRILGTDVQAANGVIHPIDKVLLATGGNVVQSAVALSTAKVFVKPELTFLVAAVLRCNLQDLLSAPGPYTVFAPTDQAFIEAGIPNIDAINKMDVSTLTSILANHVLSNTPSAQLGDKFTPELPASSTVTAFGGRPLQLGAFADGVLTVMGAGNPAPANMVIPDVQCTNGVVHVIDRVLLP
jgi:uncharacterized surface protein with fasciclin (FAS1) repeats